MCSSMFFQVRFKRSISLLNVKKKKTIRKKKEIKNKESVHRYLMIKSMLIFRRITPSRINIMQFVLKYLH